MIPLQTSFDALISPETLTTDLAILFVGLLVITLYATIRLRSMFGMFGWLLMLLTLILPFFTNFQLLYFWISTIAEGFVLALAMLAYTRQANRQ